MTCMRIETFPKDFVFTSERPHYSLALSPSFIRTSTFSKKNKFALMITQIVTLSNAQEGKHKKCNKVQSWTSANRPFRNRALEIRSKDYASILILTLKKF